MKKKIIKTTKEFTYNDKGYVVKEVATHEEWEEEIAMFTGDMIKSGVITDDKIRTSSTKVDNIYTARGITPYTATFRGDADTCGITHNITVNTDSTKSVNEIVNEVKKVLDRDMQKQKRL